MLGTTRRIWICAALAALLAPSCASKDAVSVSAAIHNPSVSVAQGTLVTTIEGSFDVALELGARASGPTDVTFQEFALLRASDGAPVLTREKISVVSSVQGAIHLEPGGKASVHFQIGELRNGAVEPSQIDQNDYAAVCAAGQVVIRGTLLDSAAGAAATPVSSAAFTPSGC